MGKTLIVISHDDRYFHVGDRIIHLVDGKVAHIDLNAVSDRPVDEVERLR
jgi:putative ATP-binding cassette transporter